MSKPRPACCYMARLSRCDLVCVCGAVLDIQEDGTYICRADGCQWQGKPMKAVIFPAAAMYEVRK